MMDKDFASLDFQGGQPVLYRNPGRALLVFKNFYGLAIPGTARQVIILGFGEWDVLAQYLGRGCTPQPKRIGRCDGRRSGWLLSGRRPGRL